MTDKTMPKWIYVSYSGFDANGYAAAFDAHVKMRDGTDFTPHKYIRADLVHGDPNEPLADGQVRWVRVDEEDSFTPAIIKTGYFNKDDLVYFVCGNECELYVEDCYEWGPVIRPPEENLLT